MQIKLIRVLTLVVLCHFPLVTALRASLVETQNIIPTDLNVKDTLFVRAAFIALQLRQPGAPRGLTDYKYTEGSSYLEEILEELASDGETFISATISFPSELDLSTAVYRGSPYRVSLGSSGKGAHLLMEFQDGGNLNHISITRQAIDTFHFPHREEVGGAAKRIVDTFLGPALVQRNDGMKIELESSVAQLKSKLRAFMTRQWGVIGAHVFTADVPTWQFESGERADHTGIRFTSPKKFSVGILPMTDGCHQLVVNFG